MRLGWRNPRPNDFQTPDQRPLKDMFGNLQQFMTWPHFDVDIDATQATGGALTKLTITPTKNGDPYSLVRANDTIQVPTDFNTWALVAVAGIYITVAGAARCILGWQLNGFDIPYFDGEMVTKAGAVDARIQAPIILPVTAGNALAVTGLTDAAGTVALGRAMGFFLPLV